MADKDLQVIASSGDLTGINLGGTATTNKVLTKGESDAAYLSFDNSLTSLTATTIQAALEELANVGYAHMILATPYTGGQALTTTPTKISAFDTIHHDVNGAITPIVDASEASHTHKFTIDKVGTFNIYGTLIAEFASSNDVTIELYKNGAASGQKVNLQGRGAGKPVQFTYLGDIEYVVTDYIELWAYSDSSTSLLVTGSSMMASRKAI